MTIEEKKAAVRMYMKTLLSSAGMIHNLLDEGHHEAAKMLQAQFCEQFEEAVDGMNKVFAPEEDANPEPQEGTAKKSGISRAKKD